MTLECWCLFIYHLPKPVPQHWSWRLKIIYSNWKFTEPQIQIYCKYWDGIKVLQGKRISKMCGGEDLLKGMGSHNYGSQELPRPTDSTWGTLESWWWSFGLCTKTRGPGQILEKGPTLDLISECQKAEKIRVSTQAARQKFPLTGCFHCTQVSLWLQEALCITEETALLSLLVQTVTHSETPTQECLG